MPVKSGLCQLSLVCAGNPVCCYRSISVQFQSRSFAQASLSPEYKINFLFFSLILPFAFGVSWIVIMMMCLTVQYFLLPHHHPPIVLSDAGHMTALSLSLSPVKQHACTFNNDPQSVPSSVLTDCAMFVPCLSSVWSLLVSVRTQPCQLSLVPAS